MHAEREKTAVNAATLILAVLLEAPRHGYAIAREIERRSDQALSPGEGALYPALRGLENEGLIEGQWEEQASGPRRRVYALTQSGAKELQKRTHSWQKYVHSVNRVMGGVSSEKCA